MAIVFELPIFVIGLTRLGILSTDKLRRNRRIGYFIVACIGVALPGVDPGHDRLRDDPAGRPLRGLDLALRLPRPALRARRPPPPARRDRALARTGCCPSTGRRSRRARSLSRTGGSSRSTPGRAERHYGDAAIMPGFVNAHSHLEYSVYAGFGDGAPFGPWLRTHMRAQAAPRRPRRCSRSPAAAWPTRSRPGITTTADYSFSGAAATAAAELGLRAIVYLEVFADEPADARAPVRREARARRRRRRSSRIGISPHAPYTCSLEVVRVVPVARHPRRHAPRRERERERVARARDRPARRGSPLLVPPTGKRAVAHARAGARARPALRALRRGLEPTRSRCSPSAASPSRTARGRTRCSAAASRRSPSCGPPGSTVGLGTDSPASTPSFDMFEEMRAADLRRAGARAAPGRAARRRTRCGSRRIDAARALRLDDQVGTLTPGKRADLAVVSLAGSPYHPVEDPAAAVVFGGSPERVLETIVDGKTRYRKRGTRTAVARGTQHRKRRPAQNARAVEP